MPITDIYDLYYGLDSVQFSQAMGFFSSASEHLMLYDYTRAVESAVANGESLFSALERAHWELFVSGSGEGLPF